MSVQVLYLYTLYCIHVSLYSNTLVLYLCALCFFDNENDQTVYIYLLKQLYFWMLNIDFNIFVICFCLIYQFYIQMF